MYIESYKYNEDYQIRPTYGSQNEDKFKLEYNIELDKQHREVKDIINELRAEINGIWIETNNRNR